MEGIPEYQEQRHIAEMMLKSHFQAVFMSLRRVKRL